MQASRFECLSFDPFSLFQNGFVTSEVDVRRRDVVQALMTALMVVVIDEGFDLGFEVIQILKSVQRVLTSDMIG